MTLTELLVAADTLLEQGQVPTLGHGGCPVLVAQNDLNEYGEDIRWTVHERGLYRAWIQSHHDKIPTSLTTGLLSADRSDPWVAYADTNRIVYEDLDTVP